MIATENICPHCGKAVQTTALQGICPECMLKAGVAAETGEVGPDGTVVAKAPSQPVPRVDEIAPHFPQLEILECLGRGGMGAVYKARQPKLDRFVALKILTRTADSGITDTEFAARFQQEARALARLNHPDIVAVYDFGEAGGFHYLLMEYVDGLTLRQLLQSQKLSPEKALAIVPKICEALQFAHERGIVHRDIKPENILLDKQGQVKIADFGIAKIMNPLTRPSDTLSPSDGERAGVRGENLTGAKDVMGTPHYMAPEQIEKPTQVDHRADIYSLGVVFYEMLTGELPLGNFQPPSQKVAVDVRLDEVVLHALEKEPDRRYQHVSEVKTDVETIAGGAAIGKPPGKSQIVQFLEVLSGTTFTSPLAIKTANISVLGFLGCLGFLGNIPSPRMRAFSAFFGFFGLFGLAGFAFVFEHAARRRKKHLHSRTGLASVAGSPTPPSIGPNELEQIDRARRHVKGPAIVLLVSGILNWLLLPPIALMFLPGISHWAKDTGIPQLLVFGVALLPLLFCSFVMYAAFKMMQLERRGAAMLASVLAMLVSPGNIIGLPIGIWALVVLNRPEVKAGFALRTQLPASGAPESPGHAAPQPPPAGPTLKPQRLAWRRAVAAALGVFITVFALLALATALMTREYEGKARIAIEDAKLEAARSDGELDWMLRDVVWSFRAPVFLDRVATELNLRNRWAKRYKAADLGEGQTRTLLERRLFVERIPRTAMFDIKCFNEIPEEAAEIANKAAEIFISCSTEHQVRLAERAAVPRQHTKPNEPLNLAFAAAVALVLGIVAAAGVLLVSAIRPEAFDSTPRPRQKTAGGTPPKSVRAARWTARVFGTLLLAFYGMFVLGEGLPPMGSQPEGVQLNFLALGLMLLGFIIGWKREGAAALLIALGWTVWHVSEGRMRWNLFQTPLPVALLYGYCWWATRGRKTTVLVVGTAIALLALLGFGRLFVPTSVFVRGTVADAQSGTPVPNAEMRLLPRPARSLEKGDQPNALGGKDGRFALYVGWYTDAKEVAISAPGYATLRTNLGPRALGQRSVSQDFQLNRVVAATVEPAVPPVVVATFPESGAADVDPTLTELRVTFSKPMKNGSWAWGKRSEENFPEMTGEPSFLEGGRTCVLPVRLKPGHVYALWLNSEYRDSFKDREGQSALPYLLIFQTGQH